MEIRRAEEKDIPFLLKLLGQVNLIHHNGRPDIFNIGTKYTVSELEKMLSDADTPIMVADDEGTVNGYVFCAFQRHRGDNILTDITTLYIDELCVDENCRRQHIGKKLYGAALQLAKESGCHNVTLNVWNLNPDAVKFYLALGMNVMKTTMEQITDD